MLDGFYFQFCDFYCYVCLCTHHSTRAGIVCTIFLYTHLHNCVKTWDIVKVESMVFLLFLEGLYGNSERFILFSAHLDFFRELL